MPSQQRYQRIIDNKQNCPKCGRHLDNINYTTCSICRNARIRAENDRTLRRDAMALFGIGIKKSIETEEEQKKALQDRIRRDILPSIELTGSTETIINPIIASKNNGINNILDYGSGSVRLQRSIINKFKLVLIKPPGLSIFEPHDIRCYLCNRVIAFNQRPVWHYSIRYAVNHFHYFVCSNEQSLKEQKVNASCYRRD